MPTYIFSGFSQALRKCHLVVQADSAADARTILIERITMRGGKQDPYMLKDLLEFGLEYPNILDAGHPYAQLSDGEEDD